MADLGFLPVVRRLLDQTPRDGQRLLFSATLDAQVDVLVKRFLHDAVVHEADSAQSPVSTMTHHVLHVDREQRFGVLADLASAPGRTVVFTRTKHGAKALARQLNAKGIPTVDLHGNLSQNARTRNMDAFHSGKATTLVATDIAARGIHVDDVALVVHADPPVEHKAYTHRSGRTARAGSDGTVVTLATGEQLREVRSLTKAAGISPTTSRVQGTHDPVLSQLAPGERSLPGGLAVAVSSDSGAGESARAARGRQRRRRSPSQRWPAQGRGAARGSRQRSSRPGCGPRRQGSRHRPSGRSSLLRWRFGWRFGQRPRLLHHQRWRVPLGRVVQQQGPLRTGAPAARGSTRPSRRRPSGGTTGRRPRGRRPAPAPPPPRPAARRPPVGRA